ncbi:unnamed protein product [Linum tenue]|uniref:GDSL esterase/lipase n=1 Tax=Linum tenue TaxID=586396 RepID=A0AAV0M0U2_9ROSI|nr:unnamed protein product [Linum tenue]
MQKMAQTFPSPPPAFLPILLSAVVLLFPATISASAAAGSGCFTSIISFGDSIADTGNLCDLSPPQHLPHMCFPPYGNTFFHRPTGRSCDGRLIIDFIAEHLGLPLVPASFDGRRGDIATGVNFAVAGATALGVEFLKNWGVPVITTNVSLRVQLDLFRELMPSLCNSGDSSGKSALLISCNIYFRKENGALGNLKLYTFEQAGCNGAFDNYLFLMGEIGGNDYNYPLMLPMSFEKIQQLVPIVVNSIGLALRDVIELGAVHIMVPGNFPVGCIPVMLAYYSSSNPRDYDPSTGCLTWLNQFAELHNDLLQTELSRLRKLYPHVNIIYADYYNAMMRIYRSPQQFGFTGGVLKACCGGGGPYNVNTTANCGNPVVKPCDDPSTYVNWDGIHFTEATYRLVAKYILEEGSIVDPRLGASSCATMDSKAQVL